MSNQPNGQGAALDRMVDSSLWKLVQPILIMVVGAMLQQVLGRLDRMEASQNIVQTAQALTAQKIAAFDAAKLARDAELAEVHRTLAEQAAHIAVLEAKGQR